MDPSREIAPSADYPRVFYDGQGDDSAGFVTPYKVNSGSLRGTQTVGHGSTQIDSANNRIVLGNIILDGNSGTITTTNSDGSSVGMGLIPGTVAEFGFFATDANGSLVWKRVGPTGFTYDLINAKNILQDGKLPDGTYGWVSAVSGKNVAEGF